MDQRFEFFAPIWRVMRDSNMTAEEVKELKGQNLLQPDWEPPTPLIDLCPEPLKAIAGAWQLDAMDFYKRRFAIVDGNNRVIRIINTLADLPNFMDGVVCRSTLTLLKLLSKTASWSSSRPCTATGLVGHGSRTHWPTRFLNGNSFWTPTAAQPAE